MLFEDETDTNQSRVLPMDYKLDIKNFTNSSQQLTENTIEVPPIFCSELFELQAQKAYSEVNLPMA